MSAEIPLADEPIEIKIDGAEGPEADPWAREREIFEQAWERIANDEDSTRRSRSHDLSELVQAFAETIRILLSPETFRHWEDALRRLLVALRDLIEAAITWLDRDQKATDVEDIPID